MTAIRVGIIGANPDRGWASSAHVPALTALDAYELTAVGTTRTESAERAAREFGAKHAFTDPRELATSPDVDLVVVTVKVPHHAELIRAAVAAGKHVLSEWPLGLDLAEASALAEEARKAGVRHAVGLQARRSPAGRYARELIEAGHLGEILSVNAHVTRVNFADGKVPEWAAYTVDPASRAGTVEVSGGHTLDLIEYLVGEITDVTATTATRRPQVTLVPSGDVIAKKVPDHLLLHASLASGALLSAHFQDAKLGDPHARIEISGSDRDLVLSTIADPADPLASQIQVGELKLYEVDTPGGTYRPVEVPARLDDAPAGLSLRARNVAAVYAAFAEDLRDGGQRVADFDTAVRAHQVLDAVETSAGTGTRQRIG